MISAQPSPLKRPKLMAVQPLQPPPVVPAGLAAQPSAAMPPSSSAAPLAMLAPPTL
jgi:hypothetical protein